MNWDIRARIEKAGFSAPKPQRSVLQQNNNFWWMQKWQNFAPLASTSVCIQVRSFWSANKSMLQIIKSCKGHCRGPKSFSALLALLPPPPKTLFCFIFCPKWQTRNPFRSRNYSWVDQVELEILTTTWVECILKGTWTFKFTWQWAVTIGLWDHLSLTIHTFKYWRLGYVHNVYYT